MYQMCLSLSGFALDRLLLFYRHKFSQTLALAILRFHLIVLRTFFLLDEALYSGFEYLLLNILIDGSSFSRVRLFRSEEHTSELQSRGHLVCRLLLEKKNKTIL